MTTARERFRLPDRSADRHPRRRPARGLGHAFGIGPRPDRKGGTPCKRSRYQPEWRRERRARRAGRGRRATRRGVGEGAARGPRRPGGEAHLSPGRRGSECHRLGRRDPDRHDGRRLGAGYRDRPPRAVRLSPDNALWHGQALPRELPHAVHRACHQCGQRRQLEPDQAVVCVQGLRPVRPDHRGGPEHGPTSTPCS